MPPSHPRIKGQASSHKAHMTWAARSMSHTVRRTGLFLRRQIWLWPIIAVLLLSAVGLLVRSAIERTMKDSLSSELQTLLDIEVAMLENWLDGQKRSATSIANDPVIRELTNRLLSGEQDEKLLQTLSKELAPWMASYDYDGFFIVNKKKVVIAASEEQAIGNDRIEELPGHDQFISRSLDGEPSVSRPLPSFFAVKDHTGRFRTETPVMFASAPIFDQNLHADAAIALRFRPDNDFTSILQRGRIGATGETYAFDELGLMLSNSRFDEDLILLGLLPDVEGSRSILHLLIRDPGHNLTSGAIPDRRRREMPLTRMVESAVNSGAGIDVEGYRDYRGVQVVGAWTWLNEYQFGVATEIDAAEAYKPLTILQRTFWGLFTLLALSSVAIFVFTLQVARLRRDAQEAAIEAQQLGQYRLEHKLGAGAMGVVYKAHHAMLRRPTAVKMLEPDKVNEQAIADFEREVQITSQLCHPNTVAIFDYGHTPEGLFYYAMEYLDGIDLQQLVDRYGPQPEGRVVDLLKQMCGSLYEAHTMGLVHRDIKPANIMLNRRGADPDVVKVLDFGLVKMTDESRQSDDKSAMAGTPLYMSPEAIQLPESVDARSDLYAVGAVGYFLLTGRPVFDADSIVELCQKHVDETPRPPSVVLGRKVNETLEDALLACLEKSRAKRPQTGRELALRLDRVEVDDGWNVEKADLWWSQHERGLATPTKSPSAAETTNREHEATIAQ